MIFNTLLSNLCAADNVGAVMSVLQAINNSSVELSTQEFNSISKALNKKVGLKTSFGGNMLCAIDDKACQVIEDHDSEEKVTFDPASMDMTLEEQDELRLLIVKFVEQMNYEDDFEESQRAKVADYDS